MHTRVMTAILIAPLVVAPVLAGDSAVFELIPHAVGANDMSPDGRYIVGEADWNGDGFADGSYLWDTITNTFTDLDNNVDPTTGIPVVAVSDDGEVVLGNMPDPNDPNAGGSVGNVAAIWRASTGQWQSLGYLPNAGFCPSRSSGYELSADGSVAVGLSWDGCSGRGFRWTQATGMVEMQNLAMGGNRASIVSADGSLLAGFAQGSFTRTPTVWDAAGNGELMDPPNGEALGEFYGMRDDGSVLLGTWAKDPNVLTAQATMWTHDTSGWHHELIGAGSKLPGWEGIPMDIADDGTIVGFDFLVGNRRAWIQPGGQGDLRNFKAYIESLGAVVPSGTSLEVCQAISADGRTIVGHGFGTGAWRVTIIHCPADLDGDMTVNLTDLGTLLGNYGCTGGDCVGDINGDEVTDLTDLGILLGAYGTTCQ